MSLIKKPYELSVWNEVFNKDGARYESKGAIIGADDMTYIGKAVDVVLKREVKGTNTLTFSLPTKYFDSEKGDFVQNEFVDELYNERKIKLNFDGTWYEFYIKKISEEKKFKAIMKSYTCEDSFINELSRTGYEVEFDETLNNSVEESGVFMIDILEHSIWDYTPEYNIGDFTEFNEQKFYKIPLSLFGGSLKAYPINLIVDNEDFNPESDYYKKVIEEEGEFNVGKENYIQNIIKKDGRKLEYGDDLARVKELFWDPYYKDNGKALLSSENLKGISGDYIYVPVSDLSPIQGSILTSSAKATEEPALYGSYTENNTKYALQPSSTNPRDLIQFIYFNDGDEVLIDEVNVISDNRYHYVIPIEDWNEALRKKLGDKKSLIHWTTPADSDDIDVKYIVHKDTDKNLLYTVNVTPDSSTIDNFHWYPVYSDGYLVSIGGREVAEARKISITDRTELNLGETVTDDMDSSQSKESVYVTVYNNKSSEFKDLYSEDDFDDVAENEYRVVSKLQTRQILPTLADNLVTNGTEISDTNGWEAKIQNNNDDILGDGFASYTKLMELNVKNTKQVEDVVSTNIDTSSESFLPSGDTDDKNVSDYYLEILSPYIDICSDLSVDGHISTDYCLNFGLSSQDKKIEKNQVYAIRIRTGNWVANQYTYHFYNVLEIDSEDGNTDYTEYTSRDSKISETGGIVLIDTEIQSELDDNYEELQKAVSGYRSCISEWGKIITENFEADMEAKKSVKKDYYYLTFEDGEEVPTVEWQYKTLYKSFVSMLKSNKFILKNVKREDSEEYTNKTFNYLTFFSTAYNYAGEDESVITGSDLKYGMASVADSDPSGVWSSSEVLADEMLQTLVNTHSTKEEVFSMTYNSDLDKIIIGEGSVGLDGNYVLAGTKDNDNKGNYIKFFDLFEQISKKDLLRFVPNSDIDGSDFLTKPLYRKIITTSEKNIDCDDGTKETKINQIWGWTDKQEDSSIPDNAFLLFKAKTTIENPYIGIKVDSSPAETHFNNVVYNTYSTIERAGIKIEPIVPLSSYTGTDGNIEEEQYELVDNLTISLYKVNEDTFSSDFLTSIGYDASTGKITLPTGKTGDRDIGELKDGDLLSSTPLTTYTSSSTTPVMFNGVEEGPDGQSRIYALFVNDLYYGIFWMQSKKTDDEEEGGEDE